MDIGGLLREKLTAAGAAKLGFADLRRLPAEGRGGFDRGVSLVATFAPEAIAGIGDGPTLEYVAEHRRLNQVLDDLGDLAAETLRSAGFHAVNQSRAAIQPDMAALTTPLPHKTVATLAGMGWIGKCALLVTEEYGSAVKLGCVLTDAPLETAVPVETSRCGDCGVCAAVCPGQAVKGPEWSASARRAEFFDVFRCKEAATARAMAKLGMPDTICALCCLRCPWTRRYLAARGV